MAIVMHPLRDSRLTVSVCRAHLQAFKRQSVDLRGHDIVPNRRGATTIMFRITWYRIASIRCIHDLKGL